MSAVLIIQPELSLRAAWYLVLPGRGHEVLAVGGVVEAVSRIREGGLELIVLDAAARLDDAVRELVAELDRLPDVPPLVLVSDSPGAPELSAQIGAAGFLPKPCTDEDLLELVERVTGGRVRAPQFDDETTAPRNKDF